METVLGFARPQQRCEVHEASQVAAARRAATDLATALGFDETATGEAALLVTEAATNILKHASHGEILLRAVRRGGRDGLEIVALDHGPGMANVARNMEDGTSGAGTYGIGLGAMQRLSHEFDIYSAPGKGTVVHLLAWPGNTPPDEDALQLGAVCLPMAGESVCGDAWSLACGPTRATVVVADGLGHGPDAAAASEAAGQVLQRAFDHPPATIIDDAHAALRATRGAAVAVAQIDTHDEELRFAGVGNIAAHLYQAHGHGQERKQLVSHNGIVGSNVRKIQEFVLPWQAGAMLVLHSDGLASRWDVEAYPGLLACHPAIVAAVLYRDFCRRRDDVTVLVLRDRQG